jgi:hypothetical protein
MVLHLLGKKSWNVYNTANIERVRRDEAEAQAREEAEEQRLQEIDARRRIALLRGEDPPPSPPPTDTPSEPRSRKHHARRDDDFVRKRRRLRGEDDTDRDIRHAREDAEAGELARKRLSDRPRTDRKDTPLVDEAGHLQLVSIPNEDVAQKAEKNVDAEAEKARKKRNEEDQYAMRFSDAAGYKQNIAQKPWYTATERDSLESSRRSHKKFSSVQEKDVWGNEDPLRRVREEKRISSSDPFAVMQTAQKQLKQSEHDKEAWQRRRMQEVDINPEDKERRRHDKRKRKRHRSSDD